MLAPTTLVRVAIQPPSRPALAEAALVVPIQVKPAPYGIAINPASHLVYVSNSENGTVSAIAGAATTVVGSPYRSGARQRP